jgi:hypothetical protein
VVQGQDRVIGDPAQAEDRLDAAKQVAEAPPPAEPADGYDRKADVEAGQAAPTSPGRAIAGLGAQATEPPAEAETMAAAPKALAQSAARGRDAGRPAAADPTAPLEIRIETPDVPAAVAAVERVLASSGIRVRSARQAESAQFDVLVPPAQAQDLLLALAKAPGLAPSADKPPAQPATTRGQTKAPAPEQPTDGRPRSLAEGLAELERREEHVEAQRGVAQAVHLRILIHKPAPEKD